MHHILVGAVVWVGQLRHTFADPTQFAKETLLGALAIAGAMQEFAEGLMNGGGLAAARATSKFVGERDSGQAFNVQGHERLRKSTIVDFRPYNAAAARQACPVSIICRRLGVAVAFSSQSQLKRSARNPAQTFCLTISFRRRGGAD
ncbi:hypothetical protein AGR4C_pa70050 [Agrobacterium tumefaciens str. Kerr 14]|uniref:Uncharacterized protein n=1 Tax=Agrobacterium tumefaciens str. Kerr 14 TaxID=1183424 RepID=A0A1S7SDV9_AGRTU|nr:hypothetical protein AGR4C_pa70050 [Agrobacterium tumefaciens str. Kerr 14]